MGLLTQLKYLALCCSSLTGTIPSTLGNLVQLTFLGLSRNQLTGTIPATLGNLVQLTLLSLCNNQLTIDWYHSIDIDCANIVCT